MSYSQWIDYGYGVKISNINPYSDIDYNKLKRAILRYIPAWYITIKNKYSNIISINDITKDFFGTDNYLEDTNIWYVINLIANEIANAEYGILNMFISSWDSCDEVYIMFEPKYPWGIKYREECKSNYWNDLTTDSIDKIFEKLFDEILIDNIKRPKIDYYESHNGG